MAGAVALMAPRAEAASLSLGTPEQVAVGWTRAAGHYDSGAAAPTFQAVVRCATGAAHVLYSIVHLAPAEGALWLDLPGTPNGLVPADVPCESPEVSLEMVVDAKVVASAPLSRRETVTSVLAATVVEPTPAAPELQRRLHLNGQKYASPVGRRTEAGVVWSLDSRVSIQLNYARTAQVPMMSYANDNGILARLRFGF